MGRDKTGKTRFFLKKRPEKKEKGVLVPEKEGGKQRAENKVKKKEHRGRWLRGEWVSGKKKIFWGGQ